MGASEAARHRRRRCRRDQQQGGAVRCGAEARCRAQDRHDTHRPAPPYAQLDPEPLAAFLAETLPALDQILAIDTIVPAAHGAALALTAADGSLAMPVMDYMAMPPADGHRGVSQDRAALLRNLWPAPADGPDAWAPALLAGNAVSGAIRPRRNGRAVDSVCGLSSVGRSGSRDFQHLMPVAARRCEGTHLFIARPQPRLGQVFSADGDGLGCVGAAQAGFSGRGFPRTRRGACRRP